jgi:hypothetical protein
MNHTCQADLAVQLAERRDALAWSQGHVAVQVLYRSGSCVARPLVVVQAQAAVLPCWQVGGVPICMEAGAWQSPARPCTVSWELLRKRFEALVTGLSVGAARACAGQVALPREPLARSAGLYPAICFSVTFSVRVCWGLEWRASRT